MTGRTAAVLIGLLLLGCGGRVDGGSSADAGAGAAGDGQTSGLPTQPLPDCVLGPPMGSTSNCPFFTKGRCYAHKIDACACACPTDHTSVCSSGFPSDDGTPVEVSCF